MRISRGIEIMGDWSVAQIKKRLGNATLSPSDFYYDEDLSEWFPLAELSARQPAPKMVTVFARTCYCGSGLSFHVCHGDGSQY
jgi:hypothetical protein